MNGELSTSKRSAGSERWLVEINAAFEEFLVNKVEGGTVGAVDEADIEESAGHITHVDFESGRTEWNAVEDAENVLVELPNGVENAKQKRAAEHIDNNAGEKSEFVANAIFDNDCGDTAEREEGELDENDEAVDEIETELERFDVVVSADAVGAAADETERVEESHAARCQSEEQTAKNHNKDDAEKGD